MREDGPSRPPQEPDTGRPEESVASSKAIWIMLAILAVMLFAVLALFLGGRLGLG